MSVVFGKRTIVSAVASGNLDFAEPAAHRFVRRIGDDVLQMAGSGAIAYGVLQNKPRDNEHASICVEGFTKLVFGESIGVGAALMSNNGGYAIKAVTSGGMNYVCGRSEQAANSGMIGQAYIYVSNVGSF